MKMAEHSPNRLKTLWEKEKLLVTSNFSFSHSVFKRLVLQTRKNQGLFGKGLNFWLNHKIFDQLKFKNDKINVTEKLEFVLEMAENIWEKEKMLVTSIFSFSPNAFEILLPQGY